MTRALFCFPLPTENSVNPDSACLTGHKHAAAFIQCLIHSSLSEDELFIWLSHYLAPLSGEAKAYLRGYLSCIQKQLGRGTA